MAPSTPSKSDTQPPNNKELELFAAVFQCLETEPKVDLEKLRGLLDLPTRAATNTKWYRLRQKYMPQAVTPQKRKAKAEGGGDGDGDVKSKNAKTPTKKKKKVKGEEEIVKAEVEDKVKGVESVGEGLKQ